ncbi:MAG TPA: YciI family protein [Caulobacter sp.]|nr:YciI family protein [Caulobacter sp.]
MPRFITIGYGDRSGYDRTAKAVRDAAHAADAERVREGDVMGVAGKPVQVRNYDAAGVQVTQGPFLSAGLPVAGFALIEAPDLDAAIEIAARSPCAVAQGVVEIWPLDPPPGDKG